MKERLYEVADKAVTSAGIAVVSAFGCAYIGSLKVGDALDELKGDEPLLSKAGDVAGSAAQCVADVSDVMGIVAWHVIGGHQHEEESFRGRACDAVVKPFAVPNRILDGVESAADRFLGDLDINL